MDANGDEALKGNAFQFIMSPKRSKGEPSNRKPPSTKRLRLSQTSKLTSFTSKGSRFAQCFICLKNVPLHHHLIHVNQCADGLPVSALSQSSPKQSIAAGLLCEGVLPIPCESNRNDDDDDDDNNNCVSNTASDVSINSTQYSSDICNTSSVMVHRILDGVGSNSGNRKSCGSNDVISQSREISSASETSTSVLYDAFHDSNLPTRNFSSPPFSEASSNKSPITIEKRSLKLFTISNDAIPSVVPDPNPRISDSAIRSGTSLIQKHGVSSSSSILSTFSFRSLENCENFPFLNSNKKQTPVLRINNNHTANPKTLHCTTLHRKNNDASDLDFPLYSLDFLKIDSQKQQKIYSSFNSIEKICLKGHSSPTILLPGMVLFKNRLTIEVQQKLVESAQTIASNFRRPKTAGGGQYHLYSAGWGGLWNGSKFCYSENKIKCNNNEKVAGDIPKLPQWIAGLAQDLALEAHTHTPVLPCGKSFHPDVGLVNYYPAKPNELGHVSLGGHQDLDDSSLMPVVSLSVGDSMTFFYRKFPILSRRKSGILVKVNSDTCKHSENGDMSYNREMQVVLCSGDVLVFGGDSRLIFHGTRALLCSTKPPELQMVSGRLNFTLRQHSASITNDLATSVASA